MIHSDVGAVPPTVNAPATVENRSTVEDVVRATPAPVQSAPVTARVIAAAPVLAPAVTQSVAPPVPAPPAELPPVSIPVAELPAVEVPAADLPAADLLPSVDVPTAGLFEAAEIPAADLRPADERAAAAPVGAPAGPPTPLGDGASAAPPARELWRRGLVPGRARADEPGGLVRVSRDRRTDRGSGARQPACADHGAADRHRRCGLHADAGPRRRHARAPGSRGPRVHLVERQRGWSERRGSRRR